MNPPILFIFAGLPGSGKSTLSQRLAGQIKCAYVRIDTGEEALRNLCGVFVETEGYQMAYRLAKDNLKIGVSVVADSCNPVGMTRVEWQAVARDQGAEFLNIEVCCSDKTEHRRRIEGRTSNNPGLKPLTWAEVRDREYDAWTAHRIVIDTYSRTIEESVEELFEAILKWQLAKAEKVSFENGG